MSNANGQIEPGTYHRNISQDVCDAPDGIWRDSGLSTNNPGSNTGGVLPISQDADSGESSGRDWLDILKEAEEKIRRESQPKGSAAIFRAMMNNFDQANQKTKERTNEVDEFEMVLMKEFPASVTSHSNFGSHGSYRTKIYEKILTLTPELPIARFKFPNRRMTQSLQSSLNSTRETSDGKRTKVISAPTGYKYITRSEAVGERDGEWFLYVGLWKDDNGNGKH